MAICLKILTRHGLSDPYAYAKLPKVTSMRTDLSAAQGHFCLKLQPVDVLHPNSNLLNYFGIEMIDEGLASTKGNLIPFALQGCDWNKVFLQP